MYTTHKKTKKKFVVAARDFVSHVFTNRKEDGSAYNIVSSTACQYELAPEKGVVRAECPVGGHYMKVDPSDPNRCEMTVLNEIDLRGNVPQWVLKTAFKDQGYIINRIRKVMPEW